MSGERSRSSFADDPDVNPDEHEEVQIIAATNPTGSVAGRLHSWCRQRHRPPYDAAFARAGASVVVTDLSEQANQVTASMIEDRRAGARRSMRRISPRPSTMRRPTSGLVPRDHRRRGDAAIPAFPRDEMS
jgi:hypothetical protein